MTILKQFTLACTPKGEIGKGDDLLFTSSVDFAKFKAFTRKTVMIAGRKTAQQMIDAKVRLQDRPMIVLSEKEFLTGTFKDEGYLIRYATNFDDAILMAEKMVEEKSLLGWTIVGGKSVYDQMFNRIDSGYLKINRAYMFVTEIPDWATPAVPVTLGRDVGQIVTLVTARMADDSVKIHKCDPLLTRPDSASTGKAVKPTQFRGSNGAFYELLDKAVFDFDNISYDINGTLSVKSGGYLEAIKPFQIVGYHYRQDVDSVELRMINGHTVSLRPGSKAAVNALLLTLQSF